MSQLGSYGAHKNDVELSDCRVPLLEIETEDDIESQSQTGPHIMHKYWLYFLDENTERRYRAEHRGRFSAILRVALFVGIILGMVHTVGYWDIIPMTPEFEDWQILLSVISWITALGSLALLFKKEMFASERYGTILRWGVPVWIMAVMIYSFALIVFRSAAFTLATGEAAGWLYTPAGRLLTAQQMAYGIQGFSLYWEVIVMCFYIFLTVVPFPLVQTAVLSTGLCVAFTVVYLVCPMYITYPIPLKDIVHYIITLRLPALSPVWVVAPGVVVLKATMEKLTRGAFTDRILRQALESKIAQQALEKETTLRQDAEYRLEFERTITTFVCTELQDPFTTVKAATRFVSDGLTQVRKSRTPPPDLSDRLGSALEWCQSIQDSSCYISEFLDNVLDLSRIEQNKLLLSDEPVYLAPIAANVHSRMCSIFEEKLVKVRFQIKIDSTLCVSGDEARLEQVLGILAENALNRTAVGFVRITASVWRNAETGEQKLKVQVVDTGSGISSSDVPFLLRKRAPTMNAAAGGGLGGGEGGRSTGGAHIVTTTAQLPPQAVTPPLSASGAKAPSPRPSPSVGGRRLGQAQPDGLRQVRADAVRRQSAGVTAAAAHTRRVQDVAEREFADWQEMQKTKGGLGLVIAHQIVRLWGSPAGLQVRAPPALLRSSLWWRPFLCRSSLPVLFPLPP